MGNAKTVLVTGATAGIGRQTARELASAGFRVLVHGRDRGKVDAVINELSPTSHGAGHSGYVADLSSLAEVRRVGDEIAASERRLDVLLHNAGVFMNERVDSADGYEMTLAVNHLAVFELTRRLRPLLASTGGGRVVTVASMAHSGHDVHWDDPNLQTGFTGHKAYGQSKLANILFSNELAKRMSAAEGEDTTSNSLHPGVVTTKLLEAGWGMTGASLEEGSRTSVHLALSPTVEGVTGRYFNDCSEVRPSPSAQDADAADRLWGLTERLVDSTGAA